MCIIYYILCQTNILGFFVYNFSAEIKRIGSRSEVTLLLL